MKQFILSNVSMLLEMNHLDANPFSLYLPEISSSYSVKTKTLSSLLSWTSLNKLHTTKSIVDLCPILPGSHKAIPLGLTRTWRRLLTVTFVVVLATDQSCQPSKASLLQTLKYSALRSNNYNQCFCCLKN